MRIYGINPVREALRAGRVTAIRVSDRSERDRLTELVRMAEEHGIAVRRVPAEELARAARGGAHQGVVADVRDEMRVSLDDLLTGAGDAPLVVVLDQIEDPHNVGA